MSVLLEPIIWFWYLFPWSFMLVVSGVLVNQWIANFWLVFFIWVLWNLIWSSFNYFLWLKAGKRVIKHWFWFLSPKYFQKWINFTKKYKGYFLLLWKLIPWIKEIITFLWWVFTIPFKVFAFWNILWCIIRFFVYFLLWYLFWYSWKIVINYFWKLYKILFVMLVIITLLLVFREFLVFFWKKTLIFLKQFYNFILLKIPLKYQKFIKKLSFRKVLLLLIIFSVIYLFLSYVWFTKMIYSSSFFKQIDISVSNMMFYFYDPLFEKIALFISYFWNIITILFLILIMSFFVEYVDVVRIYRVILWFVFIFTLVFLTKLILIKPNLNYNIYKNLSYSFPSFHAAITIFFYWLISVFLLKKAKYWNEKVNILIIWMFIIILIWLSRIYLNINLFSDVLWWYWIGLFILILVLLLNSSNRKKIKIKTHKLFLILILLLIFINLVFYFKRFVYFPAEIDIWKNILSLSWYFNKMPELKYTTTLFLRKTEPINFIFFVRNKNTILSLFLDAWFKIADWITLKNLKRLIQSAYWTLPYQTAPMLPIFWNNKPQSFGFQKQDWNLSKRHHIRVWNTWLKWHNYEIRVGCAVYDDSIKWKITHRISPDLDKERDYFFYKFIKSWKVSKYKIVQWVHPILNWKNFSYDNFYTDWKAYFLWIK